jgi:hypothetical protein
MRDQLGQQRFATRQNGGFVTRALEQAIQLGDETV